jgi:hypothetical protein
MKAADRPLAEEVGGGVIVDGVATLVDACDNAGEMENKTRKRACMSSWNWWR